MKAVQINTYGKPAVIEINPTAPKPSLKPSQILVEVKATSINAIDWKLLDGMLSKMTQLPFPITLGGDFSGVVTEVAEGVTEFRVGDEVYGNAIVLGGGSGSMAQYAAANTKNTGVKPSTLSWDQSAALPLVGSSAIQALTEHMHLSSGQKILIHGGAGGIGSIAIQLAKSLGAYVATTVSSKDIDFVKALGADEVIDYKNQKFEEVLKDFDCVYDTVGGDTTEKSFLVLKDGGILVSMTGQPNEQKAKEKNITAIGQQTHTSTGHLETLKKLVEEGKIKPQVDKTYAMDEAKDAFIYQEDIHPKGKVVITIP